jgi:Zn-dependent M28 family amino/carboxypeptidase
VGEPDARGDRIFNGALDNASGTASLLELARGFAKAPPQLGAVPGGHRREKGPAGLEYYATHRCIRWKRPWR